MKKIYSAPYVKVIPVRGNDIIMTSGGSNPASSSFGSGSTSVIGTSERDVWDDEEDW